jgi:ABC-2 type transport system ATP-binding protein
MLEARSLTKHYGYITAVRQVSFSIGAGESLGYLGPNGAGKSTTVKMLTGTASLLVQNQFRHPGWTQS